MPEPLRPSRRAVLGAAVWSAPVVVVATAAPAFAASNEVTVVHAATKTGNRTIQFTGTVTTTASEVTATLRWVHRCDDTGNAAGAFESANDGGTITANGWSVSQAVYQDRLTFFGSTFREVLVVATRVIPANSTVPLPILNLTLTGNNVRGNSTIEVTVTSPSSPPPTVRPAGVVCWPAAPSGGTVQARQSNDAIPITIPPQ